MKKLIVVFYGDRYESPSMNGAEAVTQLAALQELADGKRDWAHLPWGSFSADKFQAVHMEDAE